MRYRKNAQMHSGASACLSLLPADAGRRKAGAVAGMQACSLEKTPAIPSPRCNGEKSLPRTRSGVRRQPRMRGAFVLLLLQKQMKRRLRTAAASIAPHLPRPLIRCCRTTFSPLRGAKGRLALSQECKAAFWRTRMLVPSPRCAGRREGWWCRKHASCTSEKAHACPFSPWRRGEGAAAAADEGRFRASSSATADETAPAHGCNADRTPPPTAPHPVLPHHLLPAGAGRRDASRRRKNASCTSEITHAVPFSPWRRGEGAAAAADEGRFRAFPHNRR